MSRKRQTACGRCLHVAEEHHDGACLPSRSGGSACACTLFADFDGYRAEQLRLRAAEMVAAADAMDRGEPRP